MAAAQAGEAAGLPRAHRGEGRPEHRAAATQGERLEAAGMLAQGQDRGERRDLAE